MNEGILALMTPFALFLLMGVSLWMFLAYSARKNQEVQQTVRLALDKGAELTPELIERLGGKTVNPLKDLRRGTVWIAIAAGLALMGLFAPDPSGNALMGMLTVAAIPLTIGIAYLVLHHNSRSRLA